jgi:hypothetical protein
MIGLGVLFVMNSVFVHKDLLNGFSSKITDFPPKLANRLLIVSKSKVLFCISSVVSVGVANKTIRIKEKIRKSENKLELK